MSKPDWKKASSAYGGKVKDIPLPHVRKFPHRGVKRQVLCRIDSFVGIVGHAKHWCPRVEEENNPLWDSALQTWRSAYDDTEGYGTNIRGPRLLSEKAAREWIQWTLRAFNPKTHEFVYEHSEKPPQWFYAREGD